MEIVALIVTVVVSVGCVWFGHKLATDQMKAQQKRQELWQELAYWRTVLAEYDREAQKVARPTIPLDYIYKDRAENPPAQFPPLEQRMMREGRATRQRIEQIAKELGIDPSLPDPSLPAQRAVTDWS